MVTDPTVATAGNWLGPIGRFELTVDKGSPDVLVSFCGDGVRRTGPTTFTLSMRATMLRQVSPTRISATRSSRVTGFASSASARAT